MANMQQQAERFAETAILGASDWEEVQQALADHDTFGPWLDQTGDPMRHSQAIIRKAERRLGNKVPY